MKSSLTIIAISGVLALAGCDNNGFARRLLRHQPTAAAASGTYTLAVVNVDQVEEGLNAKIIAHKPVPTLVLQSDGTAMVNHYPVFSDAGNYNYRFSGFKSFKATWRILPVGNVSDGESKTTKVFGISMDSLDPKESNLRIEALSFTGASTPDGLVLTLYDGSQGQRLEFSKQSEPTAPNSEPAK